MKNTFSFDGNYFLVFEVIPIFGIFERETQKSSLITEVFYIAYYDYVSSAVTLFQHFWK